MAEYLVVDVEGWEVLGIEQMGSKPDKFWIEAPPDAPVEKRRWLFKPVTTQHERGRDYAKGDDWAEKVAAEVAVYLGVPAAPVELATRQGVPGIISGIISGDISRGRTLVLGNEVLYGHDRDYDLRRRRGVPGYSVDAVFAPFGRSPCSRRRVQLSATPALCSPRICSLTPCLLTPTATTRTGVCWSTESRSPRLSLLPPSTTPRASASSCPTTNAKSAC
ncbi:MAG TPA: hypothetical protein VM142_16500 [Acidimicrobiales bacterium]|nr:hypothetical protein [Acidimicrobiales bacterium]